MPKLENLHFHFHAFSGWGTSGKSKNVLERSFNTKFYVITILNFFLENFVQKMAVKKMDFPLYLKKNDLTMVGSLFWQKKILKKPNTPKYV